MVVARIAVPIDFVCAHGRGEAPPLQPSRDEGTRAADLVGYAQPRSRATLAVRNVTRNAIASGISAPRAVHFRLSVSL